jgi:hypothetical protein
MRIWKNNIEQTPSSKVGASVNIASKRFIFRLQVQFKIPPANAQPKIHFPARPGGENVLESAIDWRFLMSAV